MLVSQKKSINSKYDSAMIQSLYTQCIKYGVVFDYNIGTLTGEECDIVVKRLQKELAAKRHAEESS